MTPLVAVHERVRGMHGDPVVEHAPTGAAALA
jgi:hypothetical protein